MSASNAFVGNQQLWATLADTLASAQSKDVLAQYHMQEMLQKNRDLASDLLLQRAISGLGGAVGPNGVPAAAPATPSAAIVPDDSPTGILDRQLQGMRRQAQVYSELAKTPGIAPKRAIELMKAADDMSKAIATDSLTLMDNRRQLYKQMGGIAGAVNDPQSLQLAWSQMGTIDPSALRSIPVDRGPDGLPLPTDRTFKAMNAFAQSSTTRAEQLTDLYRQATEKQTAEEARAREQRHEENLAERQFSRADLNSRAAMTRDATQAQRDVANIAREAGREQHALTQAQTIANELKTDVQVREFADWKKAFTTAVNYVYDAEGKPKPEGAPGSQAWSNHDSARDFMLSRQYISVVHPAYRGSLADIKELGKLSNLPEDLGKAIASVAAGKTLAQSDRVNMVNAMKEVINGANADQVKREDDALERVKQLPLPPGTNPSIYVTPYAIRPTKEKATEPAKVVDYADLGGVKVEGRGTTERPYRIADDTQFNALPKGAIFVGPDGVKRTKP